MPEKMTYIRVPAPGLFLLAAFLSFVLLVSAPGLFPPETATLQIDMKCSSGNRLDVFLNGSTQPLSAALALGERHSYIFPGIVDDLKAIRIDPTDTNGAYVEIYSIEIDGPGGALLHRFGPADMVNWPHSGYQGAVGENGTFHLISTTADPGMLSTTVVPLQRKTPAYLSDIVQRLRTLDFLLPVVTLGFTLFLACMVLERTRRPHCLIAIIMAWTVGPVTHWTLAHYHGLPDPSVAVSRAGFLGLSAGANQFATLINLAIAVLAGIAAYLLFGGRFAALRPLNVPPEPYKPTPPEESSSKRALLLGTGMALLFVVAWIPDLNQVLQIITTRQYTPEWDSNNLTYWEYLVQHGWRPFRDFWYPYAGLYVFSYPLPWGVLLQFLYKITLFGTFCRAVYVLAGRRIAAALAVFGVLAIGDHADLFPAATRYLLSITIYLCYLLIDQRAGRWGRTYYCFWFTCCLAIFVEPAQLIYSGCAVAVKLGFDLVQQRPESPAAFGRRIARDFMVPTVFLLFYLSCLALTGQAAGLLRYYLHLGDSIDFGAFPLDLTACHASFLDRDFLVLVVPCVLIGIGLFERLRSQGTVNYYADGLLGVGICGFMILQKHVVRGMGQQVFIIFVAGFLVYVLLWRGKRSWVEYFSLGGMIGGCVAVVLLAGALPAGRLLRGPVALWSTLRTLTTQTDLIRKANAEAFDATHFARFPDQLRLLGRLCALNGGTPPALFDLTDDPALYILTGQPAVYQSNVYSASPIAEQKIMVQWLDRIAPPFVVFEPGFLEWDSFQKLVRAPLIFEAVIRNYVPLETSGRYEILRRRHQGEPIAFSYWRDKIGTVVDLGHIPRASSFRRYDPCPTPSTGSCEEFLEVRIRTGPAAVAPITVPFESNGLPFAVRFMGVPEQNTYYLSLDRLWFWALARRSGQPVGIAASRLPAGVTASVISREARDGILY